MARLSSLFSLEIVKAKKKYVVLLFGIVISFNLCFGQSKIFNRYEAPEIHEYKGLKFKGPIKKVEVLRTFAKFGKKFVKKELFLPDYFLRSTIT